MARQNPRNIILCLDGTGNEYELDGTNVLRIHRALDLRESSDQVSFYDPGVGTFAVADSLTRPGRSIQRALGLAFGFGLRQNAIQAYLFIMKHWSPGDNIFVFGFSRGAYTARVVAALVHAFGVMKPGLEDLVPYALRYIERPDGPPDFRRIAAFKRQFGLRSRVTIRFLGIWDTVSSVSWAFDHLEFLYTSANRSVETLRHAVAIDEKRAFFRTNLTKSVSMDDHREVWFSGVHSDIGGGYPSEESGLSKIPLEWMMVESRKTGLKFNQRRSLQILYAPAKNGEDASPSPNALLHRSLRGAWWPCEFFPKFAWNGAYHRLHFNLGRERRIPNGSLIHQSVHDRNSSKADAIFPANCGVEPWEHFSDRASANSRNRHSPTPSTESNLMITNALIGFLGVATTLAISAGILYYIWNSGILITILGFLLWFGWIGDASNSSHYWSECAYAFLWPFVFGLGVLFVSRPLTNVSEKFLARRASLSSKQQSDRIKSDRWLHKRLFYDPKSARDFLQRLEREGRAAYRYSLQLDYGFIFAYTMTFWLVWRLAERPGTEILGVSWMIVATVLAAGFDILENTLLISLIRISNRNPNQELPSALVLISSFATTVKIGLILAVITCIEFRLIFAGTIKGIGRLF